MSIENGSYIETVKAAARARARRVEYAVGFLTSLVNRYAFAEEDSGEGQLEMPIAYRNQGNATDTLWFSFRDAHGDVLTPMDVAGDRDMDAGSEVDMMLGGVEDGLPIATFTTHPPNIYGYDGAPLPLPEIEDLILDLQRYEAAVQLGRLAAPAGEPIGGRII